MLLAETGKPLLEHTFEAASRARRPSKCLIAVDCEELAAAARQFGAPVEMTSPSCVSGTDRVAEVARRLPETEILVNVQGDEPEISAETIDLTIELLERNSEAVMSTIAAPLRDRSRLNDPACVKVVLDERGRALYFSRAPIPFARTWDDGLLVSEPPHFLQHMGIYAYRRDFLLQLAALPPSPIERLESLEQLRVLHAGFDIVVGIVEQATTGIDTPEDYQRFVERYRKGLAGVGK